MNIRWPKLDDKLFVPGGYPNLSGYLYPLDNFLMNASAYKDAGDKLIDSLENNGRHDTLAVPILFCYRQYIELKLKHVIDLTNAYRGITDKPPRIHNLRKLWDTMMSGIEGDIDDGELNTFLIVEEIIMQFHSVDSDSFVFRYLDEVPPFYQVDLGNLRDVMDGLANFLDGLSDQWDYAVMNSA